MILIVLDGKGMPQVIQAASFTEKSGGILVKFTPQQEQEVMEALAKYNDVISLLLRAAFYLERFTGSGLPAEEVRRAIAEKIAESFFGDVLPKKIN